ncbi:sensor histidine kinase [Parvularcula bermudensis]|nr:HAMP domain-containing sensor histidine kinase [Parvularcula bermudensis]
MIDRDQILRRACLLNGVEREEDLRLLQHAATRFGVSHALLVIADDDNLSAIASFGDVIAQRYPLAKSFVREVMTAGSASLASDDVESVGEGGLIARPLRFLAGAKIVVYGQVLGAVLLLHDQPLSTFGPKEVQALTTYADYAVRLITAREMTTTLERDIDEELAVTQHVTGQCEKDRTEFIALLSHELRTPLHALTGFTDLLMSEPTDQETARSYVAEMMTSIKRLQGLIDASLRFADAEFGNGETVRTTFPLKTVVQRRIATLRRTALERGCPIRLQGDLDVCLHADRGLVEQIFEALLHLAIAESHRGTTVTVRAQRRSTNGLTLQFVDSGRGRGALRPFTGYKNYLTRRTEGLRLSLALADRMASTLGARLSVRETDEGTVTELSLPPQAVVAFPPKGVSSLLDAASKPLNSAASINTHCPQVILA